MWIPQELDGDIVWSQDLVTGESRRWSISSPSMQPLELIPAPPILEDARYAVRNCAGEWHVVQNGLGTNAPKLWDICGLPGNEPLELGRNVNWYLSSIDIHPRGEWLAASSGTWGNLVLWPLDRAYPSVAKGYRGIFRPVVFSPGGRWLATGGDDGRVRLWPLPTNEAALRVIENPQLSVSPRMAFDAAGDRLVTVGYGPDLFVVPLDGGPPQPLEGFSADHIVTAAAFSPNGRLVAAGTAFGTVERKALRVWDLETGETQVFDLEGPEVLDRRFGESNKPETGYEHGVWGLAFINDSTLITAGAGGVRRWDLSTGSVEAMIDYPENTTTSLAVSSDCTRALTSAWFGEKRGERTAVALHDLANNTSRILTKFGDAVSVFAIDSGGRVAATGDADGVVRVGLIDSGDPHLFVGHEGAVQGVAISPDLKWVASSGADTTLRLWPVPDLSKPPLHTLPQDELLAKLQSLTNLRAVSDSDSSTGWKIELGPFPGWEMVPEW
jgi:WD40 repeat protein